MGKYDAVSCSAMLEANEKCFGKAVIPDYHFQNAGFVVSFNADFLGTWVSPVHFIPRYVSRRKLDNGEKEMLRHIQFESGMSLTGSNADKRTRIKPSEEIILLADLIQQDCRKDRRRCYSRRNPGRDLSGLAASLAGFQGQIDCSIGNQ